MDAEDIDDAGGVHHVEDFMVIQEKVYVYGRPPRAFAMLLALLCVVAAVRCPLWDMMLVQTRRVASSSLGVK